MRIECLSDLGFCETACNFAVNTLDARSTLDKQHVAFSNREYLHMVLDEWLDWATEYKGDPTDDTDAVYESAVFRVSFDTTKEV